MRSDSRPRPLKRGSPMSMWRDQGPNKKDG
ncbi:polymer-forming cytoskeletal family protein, partial [Xanthomonas perforans]